MAFDDEIIGGGGPDFSAESVLDKVSRSVLRDLPENTTGDMILNRLNRKLAIGRPGAEPDFGPAEAKGKEPDFADQGVPLDKLPDFSNEGTPLPAAVPMPRPRPAGAPQPPALGVTGNAGAFLKGVPTGAAEGTGGILKGAAAIYDNGIPAAPAAPQYDIMGNPIGTQSEPQAAVPAKPLPERQLHRAGQAIADLAPTMSPQERDSIAGRVGMGLGGIAPYAAAAVVNPLLGLGSGAVGMGLDTYGKVYEEAKSHGASDEVAQSVAGRSGLVAGVLGSLPLGAGKYAESLIAKVAASSAAFATAGEAQEAILQQIAKEYDPKAGYTVDQKRIIASLILGAGMGGLHHAFDDRQQQQPQPGQQPPGAQPIPPSGQMPPPGAGPGPQPGAGPRPGNSGPNPGNPGAGTPPPGGGAGPQPNSGGPGGQQQAPPGAGAGPQPGKPPPGSGTGKAGEPGYTMDPKMRSKMEDILRRVDPAADWRNMSDGELFDAVNEHMRDTSSTGHTAKPETPEEAAAREKTARDRDETAELKGAFAWMTDAQIASMTPENREVWLGRARGKPQAGSEQASSKPEADTTARETTTEQPESATTSRPDKVVPTSESDAVNPTPGTRKAPIKAETADDVVHAQPAEPTPAQAEAENFKHAHIELDHLGLTGKNSISVETGVGGTRKGTAPDGTPWEVKLEHAAYGRIKGTVGADGQPLDIFVGPHPQSPHVFIIDQHEPDGPFDEHKIMAGYRTPIDALHAYANSYDDAAKGRIGHVTAMTAEEFKAWLKSDTTKALKPPSLGPDKTGEGGSRSLTEAPLTSGDVPKETPTGGGDAGGSAPSTQKPRAGSNQPLSLMQFIASKGGVKPHAELDALDLKRTHRVQIPGKSGFFSVVRPDGMDLDTMREAAQEAGYLRGEANKTSTVRDLLDAIDEEHNRGNAVAAEGERLAPTKSQQRAQAEREAHEKERHELEYGNATADLIEAGYRELPTDLHNAATKLMVDEGLDVDTAVERAALRLVAEDGDYAVTPDSIRDTFGGGAYDEIRARPASEDGRSSAREREGGARSGEGQEDRGDGQHVPATGEARGEAEGERAEAADVADAAEVAAARVEIEQALGPDAEHVAPVDIERAAEIKADNPDMPAEVAFGHAVIETAVDQGFLTEKQAEQAYGPEVKDVLESGGEGPSVGGGAVEQVGSATDEGRAVGAEKAGVVSSSSKTRRKKARGASARPGDEGAAAIETAEQPAAGRKRAARDKTGDAAKNQPAAYATDDTESVGDFIAAIENRIADGDYDAAISPTRSLKEFQETAEARGWTYAPYGKGKALWSPDRSHVIFASVSVEGNHVTAQWSTPAEGIEPPTSDGDKRGEPLLGTGAIVRTKSGRETAPVPKIDATNNRGAIKSGRNLDQWLLDEARKEVAGDDWQTTLLKGLDAKNFSQSDRDHVNLVLFGDVDGPRRRDIIEPQPKTKNRAETQERKSFDDMTEADKKAERDAPTWAEVLHELPKVTTGKYTNPDTDLAFKIMSEINGKPPGKQKFDKLTPEQKHELLNRLKAGSPPEKTATIEGEKKEGSTITILNGDDMLLYRGPYSEETVKEVVARTGIHSVEWKKPAEADPFDDIFDKAVEDQFAKPPAPATEKGADGKQQTVLPGAEHAPSATMAKRAAAAPLKPKVAQKSADIGLFGDDHKQTDLLDMVAAPPKREKAPDLSLDDVTAGLGKLFGKGLAESESPFVDEAKYQQALPFLKAGVAHFPGADLNTMVRALVKHLAGAGMDADAIRAMKPYVKRFTDDVAAGRETINAPSRSPVLEQDRGEPEARDTVGKADVSAAPGATGQGAGERGGEAHAGDERSGGGGGLPQDHAPVVGADGNLELPAREPVDETGDAADRERSGGADRGEEGFSPDDAADDDAIRNAQKDADLNSRRERQRQAEGVEVIDGNIGNIAETLPMLHPEQHGDVKAAEDRYSKPDGYGMLFTNGTGTGKTYSGLGVIKRFSKKGQRQILVVAPSQGILTDWVRSAKDLGLDMNVLESTVDKGRPGLNGTTYANLGDNPTLADHDWHLVVADEAHKLSSDQNGTTTKALETFRALTKHPDGMRKRAEMVLRREWAEVERLKPPEKNATPGQQEAWAKAIRAFELKSAPLIEKWKAEKRPKALMMSATPFAYHFSLDYAEGYLFEFPEDSNSGAYNAPTGRDSFYIQHLGYRKRTGKLTKPDADVKQEIMERQLHEYLKKTGSLHGRALTVDKDYDRKFVLAHNAAGELIDRALTFLQEAEGGRYRPLHEIISKQFDYLARMRLLEAMKAQDAIDYIKESHALGRKVVVFHDYNEGGGISPFTHRPPEGVKVSSYVGGKHIEVELRSLYDDFAAQNPYIKDLDFAAYPPPIETLSQAFPDALIYNGNVSNKNRNEAKRLFNDDNSGRDLIVIQSAAGEAGISLHDTTGKKQRVLLNLGMPIRPTTSIQQEGRIYRVGQSSDAMFRYMNTGTDWERWTFAGKIADRAGTAENLALGNLARTIRQSFVDAFSNAGDYRPEPGEGKGGKDADRATNESISEFEKAKTHYFAQAKVSGRRDQREGKDYYATPEPVGLKMVEFAGLKPGEKILEPSAGHGAIARYFPEDSARTLVEPSSSLASRAALTSPGARVVVDNFENLDVGANKFDAIVMNPPFGTGGKTAIDHLEKAGKHLRNGGRIVALIPQGASTDKRFDAYMDSKAATGIYIVGDIKLPPVTFERAGTSINTRIVVLEKQTDPEVAQKLQQKNRDYSDVEKIGDLFDRIENADMGERLIPKTQDVDAPTEGKMTIDGVELSLMQERDGTPYAYLQNKLGIDKFKAVMRAAEANDGYYLKAAKAIRFKSLEGRQKFLEVLANPPAAAAAPSAPSGVTFKTGETVHAKTGDKLFVATANERTERDVYDQMATAAKANGGWYSSFKGRGAIPGFQFKSDEARKAFLKQMGGGLGEASARLPLGQAGQQSTLESGRQTGNEHLVAYGADGREIWRNSGTSKFVAFSPEFQKELMNPANDIVAHHNHPSGNSLSHTDLMTLAYPAMRAVWAHGHNGNIYRAELTPAFDATLNVPLIKSKRIENLYSHVKWRLHTPMQTAFNLRAITVDEANGGLNHLINEVLADAGIIDYRSNYEIGDLVSRIPGLDTAIKNAVVAARKEAFGDKATLNGTDRRAGALRHAGDVGATFDRGEVASGVGDKGRRGPIGDENDFDEEGGPGLSAPNNTFKHPNSTDTSLGEVLRTRLLGKLGDLNATEARAQLQDKFIRVKKAEDSVGAPTSLSAYQAESLYYGRTGQRLESLNEHHIDPIIRELKARDISLDKLDEFLYARHAPERNNKIGAMYSAGHDFYDAISNHDKVGGSGWSTNEALRVIRAARAAGKLNDYLAVARMIDALNFRTRQTLLNAGLIDRDTFDAWNSGYKYYVPLRGHAEGDQFMSTGSGMNVRGKEAKQAFGRKSKAESPTAYSIMQAEMAIVRAEKAKVGQTFVQFVRANPDPTRWTIDRPPQVKRIDPTTGLVTTVPDNLYANRDNVFTTKVNGRDVHVTLHGPDGLNLARALKNMGSANVHRLIRLYSTITHTMAKLATSLNPDFMIPNLVRDFGEAMLNLSAQEQRGFVKNFIKHLPGAMKGSMQALAGGGGNQPPGSPGRRYIDAFHEFDKAGGRIRFFGIDDPDQVEANANRKLARLQGGAVNTIKDIGDKASKALEIAGGGLENATRLAAYMAARDAGFSIDDAAMMARNLTVDFNKKGELGGAISALYMFANAGIQGQARMVKALGSRRVWMAVGALGAAAAMSTLFSILNGGDDESGTPLYMKVPTWERDKNLIFMMQNGTYVKVPLPYGFAPFAVLGSKIVTVMHGHEKPGVAAAAIIDSIISAFNPLGEESNMIADIIPSAIRPAFHILFNKNWTGKPLYPEQDRSRGVRPDATQAFKNDSAFSKEAARLLNEWSGGSKYKPGAIDVHPGSIDHVLQAIGGGVGRFAKTVADTIYSGIKGDEWHPDKTPILRRFVGKIGEESDRAAFYEKRQEVKDLLANTAAAKKDLKAGVNVEQAREAIAEATPEARQKAIFERADLQMRKLRKKEDDINNGTMPYESKREALAGIREQMRKVQNDARAASTRLRQGAQ